MQKRLNLSDQRFQSNVLFLCLQRSVYFRFKRKNAIKSCYYFCGLDRTQTVEYALSFQPNTIIIAGYDTFETIALCQNLRKKCNQCKVIVLLQTGFDDIWSSQLLSVADEVLFNLLPRYKYIRLVDVLCNNIQMDMQIECKKEKFEIWDW